MSVPHMPWIMPSFLATVLRQRNDPPLGTRDDDDAGERTRDGMAKSSEIGDSASKSTLAETALCGKTTAAK